MRHSLLCPTLPIAFFPAASIPVPLIQPSRPHHQHAGACCICVPHQRLGDAARSSMRLQLHARHAAFVHLCGHRMATSAGSAGRIHERKKERLQRKKGHAPVRRGVRVEKQRRVRHTCRTHQSHHGRASLQVKGCCIVQDTVVCARPLHDQKLCPIAPPPLCVHLPPFSQHSPRSS